MELKKAIKLMKECVGEWETQADNAYIYKRYGYYTAKQECSDDISDLIYFLENGAFKPHK